MPVTNDHIGVSGALQQCKQLPNDGGVGVTLQGKLVTKDSTAMGMDASSGASGLRASGCGVWLASFMYWSERSFSFCCPSLSLVWMSCISCSRDLQLELLRDVFLGLRQGFCQPSYDFLDLLRQGGVTCESPRGLSNPLEAVAQVPGCWMSSQITSHVPGLWVCVEA